MALSFDPAPQYPVLGSSTFDTDAGAWLSWMAGQINLIATLSGFLIGVPVLYSTAGSFQWTRPAKCKGLIVDGVGGGGGGGGASSSGGIARAAAGGAAGTWARVLFDGIPASLTLTVGAGGAGGPLGDTTGSAGGNTSISELGITWPGGAGGNGGGTNAADVAITGNAGRSAVVQLGTQFDAVLGSKNGEAGDIGTKLSSSTRVSGRGGDCMFGSNGLSRSSNSATVSLAGDNAVGNGAGGSGAICSTTTGNVGGNGAPGLLIITPLY